MRAGFDLNSPLVCEGIVGDGCGGGRIFFVEDAMLQVYDPTTQECMVLLSKLPHVLEVTKKQCIISIKTHEKILRYDLSLMQVL